MQIDVHTTPEDIFVEMVEQWHQMVEDAGCLHEAMHWHWAVEGCPEDCGLVVCSEWEVQSIALEAAIDQIADMLVAAAPMIDEGALLHAPAFVRDAATIW